CQTLLCLLTISCGSILTGFVSGHSGFIQMTAQHVGNPEHTLFAHALGKLGILHIAELFHALAVENTFAQGSCPHRAKHLADEYGFKIRGHRFDLGLCIRFRCGLVWRCGYRISVRIDESHMIINSAFRAPACFNPSRIAVRSDGETPMELIVSTISDKEARVPISNAGAPLSSTEMSLFCSVSVRPRLNGAG